MNVSEVYNLFQSLVDDTDQTFLTAGNTDTYLKSGYSDFRQRVTSIDPGYYVERTHLLITSDAHKVDLTAGANFTDGIPVLGATALANNKLMSRLIRVAKVDNNTSDTLNYYLTPTNTALEVAQGLGDYCVNGTLLILAQSYNGSYLRFEYIRDPVIAWTNVATTYIDDLAPHHPLIALYAAQYYAIRDGAFNEPLNAQLVRKERELETYLSTGRLSDAAHYVTPQRGYGRF
tara:strand:+ start:3381 stop:4076 length:696 start_codon:yes stop_codon:yes gene_type:complete